MNEKDLKAASEIVDESSIFSTFDRLSKTEDGKKAFGYLLETFMNGPIVNGVAEAVLQKNAAGESTPEQVDIYYKACALKQAEKEFQLNPTRMAFMLGQQDVARHIFSLINAHSKAKAMLETAPTGVQQ